MIVLNLSVLSIVKEQPSRHRISRKDKPRCKAAHFAAGFILSISTKYYKSLILFCKIENTQKTTTVCDIIMAKV